jgi:hypothetical protein
MPVYFQLPIWQKADDLLENIIASNV